MQSEQIVIPKDEEYRVLRECRAGLSGAMELPAGYRWATIEGKQRLVYDKPTR